jgi:hypothetical protein
MLLLSCFEDLCSFSWAACLASSFMLSQVANFFAFSSSNAAIVLPGNFFVSHKLLAWHHPCFHNLWSSCFPSANAAFIFTQNILCFSQASCLGILHVVTKFVKSLFDSHLVLFFFHMEQQSTLSRM